MEAGPEPLVEVAWALIQTLPVNTRIHEELESMGGRIILPTQTTPPERGSGVDQELGYEVSGAVEASRATSAEYGAARQEPRWTRGKEGLPRSAKKERRKGSSSEVDWKTLLDGSQVLELLYRLQVVYTLVSAADDEYALPGDRADASVWRRVFLQTGGMRRLLSLLQEGGGMDPSRSLHKACLAKLLSLAAHFTTIKATTAAESFHVNFDPRLDRDDHLNVGDGGRGGDQGTSSGGLRSSSVEEAMEDTADMGAQVSTARDWKEMVRELYADVNLPELVQRLLVVMHEVSKSALEAEKQATSSSAAGDGGGRIPDNEATGFQGDARGSGALGSETEGRSNTLPEAEVVQHTMALLCALAQLEPGLSEVIVSSPCLGSALSFSLLRTPELLVRKKVAEGVMNMAQIKIDKPSQEERVQAFLGLLLPLLPEVELHESTCEYYFWLVASLVRHPNVLSVEEHSSLCIRLADLIASRSTVEESEEDEDSALYGYMSFLNNALAASPPTLEDTTKARTGMDPAPPSGREDRTGAAGGRGRGRGKGEHNPVVEAEGRGLVRELVEQCLFAVPPKRGSPLENDGYGGGDFEDDETRAIRFASMVSREQFEDVPPPKCKSRKTRLMAFKLLGQLARNCPSNLELIAELVGPHHHLGMTSEENRNQGAGDKAHDSGAPSYRSSGAGGVVTSGMNDGEGGTWRTRGALAQPLVQIARHKSKTGFVGLKNMGCICYMNSTLQQLFMVPEFRQGVLAFRDSEESSEDGLMWHLQSLFSHLQESEKAYLDPGGLVRSLRDWEGRPLDVMLQQDASEFLTLFFQQVEGRVMGSPSENLLKHSFGGTYSNELLAEGGLYSERPEPFSYISVEVKNMKTLDEALAVFTKEEVVSFKWDKDVDPDTGERRAVTLSTRKRCSIKSLPEHLMIHLKRFDFDFDSMLQTKINDRLEFPFQLNMFPYTKEGRAAAEAEAEAAAAIGAETVTAPGTSNRGDAREGQELDSQLDEKKPDEYYLYNLAGVVVHMGTANSGHYYSYIRPRDGDGEWIEFNDTVVSNFDVKDMEAECFGGEETASYTQYSRSSGPSQMGPNGGSGMGGGSSWKRERTRNAFLLVYDRLLPQNWASNNQLQRQSGLSSSVPDPSPSASFQSSATASSDSDASRGVQETPAVSPTRSSADPRVRPRRASFEVQPGGEDVQRQRRRKRRKRFRAKIPAVFLQKIWRENVEFWRQKNVLDKDYYAFLDRLVVEDMQGRHKVPSTASLKLAVRFALGTLVQARERDEMKRWTERLQAWLPIRPRACRWLLNEMFRSSTSLRELMLCHDDSVRETAKKILGTALNQASISAGGGEGGDPSGKAYVEALDAVRDELQSQGPDDEANDLGGGFVTVGQASTLPERGQENRHGERTSVLQSLWRRKGQVPRGDQAASDWSEGERAKKKRGATPEIADDDTVEAKTAYAIAVVRFIEACLGLLSVAPGIDQPDWYVSGRLLQLLQNFAETGPSERCHLLKRRALAALLLMCLGDAPLARRKERPLAHRVGSHGEAESSTTSTCPPSPTSSGVAVDEPDAISVASSRGRTGGTGVGVGMDGVIEEDSKTIGYRVTNKDIRQSALLETMCPLLLSSELPRDGDDMAIGGVDSSRAASGHLKLAPSTLLPLVKTTRREEEMLLSKALRIRLIYLLQGPREKKVAVGLMQHFCWRNELMSKMMIHNICECIEVPHDEDAPQIKPAYRALAVILNQVPDGLEQWRIELAMPKVLQTIKEHRNLRAVTEQAKPLLKKMTSQHSSVCEFDLVYFLLRLCRSIFALEMVVRLAKASLAVRQWLAARPESLIWVERWLMNMGHTKRQDQRRSQRTGGSSLRDGYGGTGITPPVGPSRVYGLRGNGPPTSVTEDQVCPVPWHETTLEMIRAIFDGQEFVSYGYDSDDEPSSLVGKRIEVKWKGNSWYAGEVMSYDPEKETHRVLYDDGDDKRYSMGMKTWRILLPASRI